MKLTVSNYFANGFPVALISWRRVSAFFFILVCATSVSLAKQHSVVRPAARSHEDIRLFRFVIPHAHVVEETCLVSLLGWVLRCRSVRYAANDYKSDFSLIRWECSGKFRGNFFFPHPGFYSEPSRVFFGEQYKPDGVSPWTWRIPVDSTHLLLSSQRDSVLTVWVQERQLSPDPRFLRNGSPYIFYSHYHLHPKISFFVEHQWMRYLNLGGDPGSFIRLGKLKCFSSQLVLFLPKLELPVGYNAQEHCEYRNDSIPQFLRYRARCLQSSNPLFAWWLALAFLLGGAGLVFVGTILAGRRHYCHGLILCGVGSAAMFLWSCFVF